MASATSTISGRVSPAMSLARTVTVVAPLCSGKSYMTSMSTRSQMERRPRAPVPVLHRLVSDGGKGCRLEGEARVLELEHAGVLLDERVLRLHEDADEILLRQLVQGGDNRNAAHELGDHAVLVQVLRQHLLQKLGLGLLLGGGSSLAKPRDVVPTRWATMSARPTKAPPR